MIPIERLTEADQRWMVSAEYGGTGGQPLVGGMCVEEPDIEIGQGVSSKGTLLLHSFCLFLCLRIMCVAPCSVRYQDMRDLGNDRILAW